MIMLTYINNAFADDVMSGADLKQVDYFNETETESLDVNLI